HDFPDLWFSWRYQIRCLTAKGYRVIAIDNLGHGEKKQYYIDSHLEKGYHGAIYYRRTFRRTFRLNHANELPYVDEPYSVPTLLAMFEKDPILHPTYIRTVSKRDFVVLETTRISKGTHSIQTENPVAVNSELERYLEKFFWKEGGRQSVREWGESRFVVGVE
ncbi:hypothetical protein BG000_004137, partial [Podila horticola]